jgi:ACS family hexuronate transporter-like MFS transporter
MIKGLRLQIIGLIALATVINHIDRSTLSLMWPSISKDLGMDKNDHDFILNVFMVADAFESWFRGKLLIK